MRLYDKESPQEKVQMVFDPLLNLGRTSTASPPKTMAASNSLMGVTDAHVREPPCGEGRLPHPTGVVMGDEVAA